MAKFTKAKFDAKRILRLYRAGKTVAEIARLIGYPEGHGNNRTRNVLIRAGVYKFVQKKSPKK